MVEEIDGVTLEIKENYAVFHLCELTNKLKGRIRKLLSVICHGDVAADTPLFLYSYTKTLSEFLHRCNNKTPETLKGMIGELLTHIILRHYFPDLKVATPFFNMEERSIKKGFDVVLYREQENDLWLVEVKSGNLPAKDRSNNKMKALLTNAKKDLAGRISEEKNTVWLNALNGAQVAFAENKNLKDAVIQAIDLTTRQPQEINAFLTGVLFAPLSDAVDHITVKNITQNFQKGTLFRKLFVLSIQKETYEKVIKFLKEEIEHE